MDNYHFGLMTLERALAQKNPVNEIQYLLEKDTHPLLLYENVVP